MFEDGVVDPGEQVGVDIIHVAASEEVFGETERDFAAVTNFFLPLRESGGDRRFGAGAMQGGKKVAIQIAGIAKDDGGEFFVKLFGLRAAQEFALFDGLNGFESEVAMADEDGTGDEAGNRGEEGERALREVERADVVFESGVLDLERRAGRDIAELTIDGIVVGVIGFGFDGDFLAQRGDLERDGKIAIGTGEIEGEGVEFEALGGDFESVGTGREIGRGEMALRIGIE